MTATKRSTRQRTAVSSETLIQTAIDLAARDGLASLSIRALAGELSISPMSVYKYVESKDELLDQMVLWVLARMEIPASFEPDWRSRIVSVMSAWRELLLSYSEIVPIMLERPIPRGSVGLARLQETVLATLDHGGMRGARAVRAFWQIFTVTVGSVMFELPRRQLTESDMTEYAEALRSVAAERGLERVDAAADDLASISSRGTFTDTLTVLVAGIAAEAGGAGTATP